MRFEKGKTMRFFTPLAVLLLAMLTDTLFAACPIVPVPKEYQDMGKTVPLGTSENAAIVVATNASEQERYAAERLQAHLLNRFQQKIPILSEQVAIPDRTQRFYFRLDENRADKKFNGFSITCEMQGKYTDFILTGDDPSGLIYGGEAFFNLIRRENGVPQITMAEVRDWPTIPWRGRPHSVMPQQLLPGQLDAYIHGRINFCDFRDNPDQPATVTMDARKSSMGCPPGKPIDQALATRLLAEAHRRGMFVYGVVSCNLPEGEYAGLFQTFDALRRVGCDGVWLSMDDTGGGGNPVALAEAMGKYMEKNQLSGHQVAFTPGGAEYTTLDKPLNHAMAKLAHFNEATWFFTRVPCQADREYCREMGLKNLPGWWYNYCEVPGVDPKAGFLHSSAILTTQRKNNKPSYMNLLPITPGWGLPKFDKIRDAGENTDHVLLWALCGGWPAEYAVCMFGQWAWNPEACDWEQLRDSLYDYVWGPSQVPLIREFDATFVELKSLYYLPTLWGFRAEDGRLVQLRNVADREKAFALLDRLDKMAAELAEKAPNETALDKTRLYDYYVEPMLTSLRFARLQATLEYPEYRFHAFEKRAIVLAAEKGDAAANAFLEEVRREVSPMLDVLRRELAELKDIEPVLKLWQTRLERANAIATLREMDAKEMELQWQKQVQLPVSEILPFLKSPLEGTLTAIFDHAGDVPQGKVLQTFDENDWSIDSHRVVGRSLVGKYVRDGKRAVGIMLPRRTPTMPGDMASVSLRMEVPENAGALRLFLADTRIDNASRGYREIEITVNGQSVFKRDIAAVNAPDWVTLDVSPFVRESRVLTVCVYVNELKAVSDHTSWVFVGPCYLLEK
ncbi:MAG: hypothetical protein Q4D98_00425 [Planctomycetia bacterium]|nr:hypothetical protein [Planctomycetia bacterium]